MTAVSAVPSPAPRTAAATGFLSRFTVLRGAPRELWLVFLAKLLGMTAYMVMNTTAVLWLTYDLGYRDAKAGFLIAAWSTVMTLITVFVGSLVDAIGLRKALLLGQVVCVASRAVMTFTTLKGLALAGGLLPLALGEALGVPVLVAGTRRYSTTAQRSISFALFYAMMNVGMLIGSFIFDYVREHLGEPHGHWLVPGLGIQLTTYRVLFLISFLFELALLIIVYFTLRDGVEATDEGVKITPEPSKYPDAALGRALGLMARDALRETVRIFAGLWRQPGFYKFLAFLSFAAFVRLIFIHMYYTYPKFGIRELGEGAAVGRLFAINSFLIIVLVPIVGALSQKLSAYRMVSFGSTIAAASVFIMALPPRWFAPLADGPLGHALANRWLGGYYRFSPDDFQDLPALARELAAPSNAPAATLNASLSETTRALLAREAAPGPHAATPYPSSALFAAGDLRDPAFFVVRLRTESQPHAGLGSQFPRTRALSQFLWEQFPAASKEELASPACPLERRQVILAEELNRILHGTSLNEQQRFAGVALSAGARCLLAEDPKPGGGLPNQSLLCNRLLLEDAYAPSIARSAHPLRVALAKDLTQLIQAGPLDRQPGFAEAALSPLTRSELARKPQGNARVRLNRLILEDAFPSYLAHNRTGVPGSVNPYYVMIFLYIVLLSIGESIYSPRLYEYAAVIAPKGQEASYMSLSYLPFFLAKLLVTSFSGVLLAGLCPETGPRHSGTLWLIIALTTTIAPLGLITLRRYIQVREAGRDG